LKSAIIYQTRTGELRTNKTVLPSPWRAAWPQGHFNLTSTGQALVAKKAAGTIVAAIAARKKEAVRFARTGCWPYIWASPLRTTHSSPAQCKHAHVFKSSLLVNF